jgi:ribosomal protein S18 acetylase RimI-like enzyme
VRDEAALADFKRVLMEGYGLPEFAANAWVEASRAFGLDTMPWQMYVAYLDGQPVATNLIYCGGGVAGVFAIATVEWARGRGIGSAITLKPLLDARDRGYRYAVLFSSEMGVPVYKRIGFRDAGVRINRYLWRNE